MTGDLHVSLEAGVLTLVIANESKRNAMSRLMTNALSEQLRRADSEDAVKVVVITGEGHRAFCSGHDLDELVDDPEAAFDSTINEVFQAPRHIGKPTIAAINGAAVAGGLNLALSCDLRVASTTATFAATGTRLALLPIAGQLSVLPQLVGPGPALDLLLRARPMDAPRAYGVGLVTEVVEPDELMSITSDAARYLSSTPVELNAAIKRAVWSSVDIVGERAREVEEREAGRFGRSDDARVRIEAFLARR